MNYRVYIGEFFTFFHRTSTTTDFQRVTECNFIPNRKLFTKFGTFWGLSGLGAAWNRPFLALYLQADFDKFCHTWESK